MAKEKKEAVKVWAKQEATVEQVDEGDIFRPLRIILLKYQKRISRLLKHGKKTEVTREFYQGAANSIIRLLPEKGLYGQTD